jgi:hypothetical protein
MGMKDPAAGKLQANFGDIIGLVHLHPDDEPIFILAKEQDFGAAATAVATKITDAAPCKGEVLAAFFILTEAKADGGANVNDVSCIAKDSGAVTKMTGDVTLDMSDAVYMNMVGSVVGVAPDGTPANRQFAKGDDIYVYTAAATGRTAGKYHTILICKKIA